MNTITITKQHKTKPCAYFMWHVVHALACMHIWAKTNGCITNRMLHIDVCMLVYHLPLIYVRILSGHMSVHVMHGVWWSNTNLVMYWYFFGVIYKFIGKGVHFHILPQMNNTPYNFYDSFLHDGTHSNISSWVKAMLIKTSLRFVPGCLTDNLRLV